MTSSQFINNSPIYRPQADEVLVGLEVSSYRVVFVVINEQRRVHRPDRVGGIGRKAAFRLVQRLTRDYGNKLVFGVEPCTYSLRLIDELRRLGFRIEPMDTKLVRSQSGTSIKNDPRDAKKIALALLNGRYTRVELSEAGIIALRVAVNERARLVKQLVMSKNRLHAIAALGDLGYEPEEIDDLREQIEYEEALDHSAAADATQAAFVTTYDSRERDIEDLKGRIRDQEVVIQKLLDEHQDFAEAARLMSLLPRVEKKTAPALVASIRNPDLIRGVDHLRGFLNLVPWQHASGTLDIVRVQSKSESERTLQHLLCVAAMFYAKSRRPVVTSRQIKAFHPELLKLASQEHDRIWARQAHLALARKSTAQIRREVGFLIAVAAWRLWRLSRQLRSQTAPAA